MNKRFNLEDKKVATTANQVEQTSPVVLKVIEKIAKDKFNVATLKTRNSDSLDFYDAAVWNIKSALEEAYLTGAASNVAAPEVKVDIKNLSKEKANALLSDNLQKAMDLIRQCENIADIHELNFSMDIEYGMGGWYDEGQWHASSQSC
jgi:translation initiation factor 2 alpha subunit (eIF-2alpha)